MRPVARARGKCVNLAFCVGFLDVRLSPPPSVMGCHSSDVHRHMLMYIFFFLVFSRFFFNDLYIYIFIAPSQRINIILLLYCHRVLLRGFFFTTLFPTVYIASFCVSAASVWPGAVDEKRKSREISIGGDGILVDLYRISVRTVRLFKPGQL